MATSKPPGNSGPQIEAAAISVSNNVAIAQRVAVCSWSLQPAGLQDLISRLGETGINRIQLAMDPLRDAPALWGNPAQIMRASGVLAVSGMFGCVGEDYSTLASIRTTGGIAPDSTWDQNLRNIRATAGLAAELGLKLVTFHAGFLPDDESDPDFGKMLNRLTVVSEIFSEKKIKLALETGQESAPSLAALLKKLALPNLGVNFDPANMILYGKGDPIQALHALAPWIRQVHIKDAKRTQVPGTWGEEVVVGTGDVDWPDFFATLEQIHFTGDLVIEREAGVQRVADIRTAREVVLHSVA